MSNERHPRCCEDGLDLVDGELVYVGDDDDEEYAAGAQPRHPKGSPLGGQWSKDGGGAAMLDITEMRKVGAKPGGTVPGAVYQDGAGNKWIVKYTQDEDRATNEVLAGKLYEAVGVKVPELAMVDAGDGKTWVGSKMMSGLSDTSPDRLAGESRLPGLDDGFAADAWLANWDVVGLGYDNLSLQGGQVVRMDVGGALEYRAQGKAKGAAFGKVPSEIDSLRDAGVNPQSARVFKRVSEASIRKGVARIAALGDDGIRDLVGTYKKGKQADSLSEKLIARKDWLINRYSAKNSSQQYVDGGGGIDDTSIDLDLVASGKLRRQRNKFEKYVNFVAIRQGLDDCEVSAKAILVPAITDIRDKLVGHVSRNFDHQTTYLNDFKSIRGIRSLKQPFLDFLLACYDHGATTITNELTNAASAIRKSMSAQIPTDSNTSETSKITQHAKKKYPPAAALKFLKLQSDFFVSGIDKHLTEKVRQILLRAIDVGEPVEHTVMELEDMFEPYIGNPRKIRDDEQIEPYRLETIVRTNATNAFNRGRLIEARGNPFVSAFEFAAIIDDVTCFAGDTLVLMSDGSRQQIRHVRVGDTIVSGSGQVRRVRAIKIAVGKKWTEVTTEDGSVVRSTSTHPYWTLRSRGFGWVEGQEMQCGDQLGTIPLQAVQQGIGEFVSTRNSSRANNREQTLLDEMPPATDHAPLCDLPEALSNYTDAECEVLLCRVLSEIEDGDQGRGHRTGGVAMARLEVPAGSGAREILGRLSGRRGVGNRSGWNILAPNGNLATDSVSKERGHSESRLALYEIDRAAGGRDADPAFAEVDHHILPQAQGTLAVIDVKTYDDRLICYDLEIEGDHSYVVGPGLIVHNTDVCRMLDGRIFMKNDPDLDLLKPPRHYNCRSTLVPITLDVQYDEDDIVGDADAGKALELSGAGFVGDDEEVWREWYNWLHALTAEEYHEYFNPAQPRQPSGGPTGGQFAPKGGGGGGGGGSGGGAGGWSPEVKAKIGELPRSDKKYGLWGLSRAELRKVAEGDPNDPKTQQAKIEYEFRKARTRMQLVDKKQKVSMPTGHILPPADFKPRHDTLNLLIENKFDGNLPEVNRLHNELRDKASNLPTGTYSAVNGYTGEDYMSINASLRKSHTSPALAARVKHIDAAINANTIPEDIYTYRRFAGTGTIGSTAKSKPNSLIGMEVTDKGFISTTITPRTGAGGSTVAMIRVPKGSKGLYAAPHSRYPNEKELILPRNSRFVVVGIRTANLRNIVEMQYMGVDDGS